MKITLKFFIPVIAIFAVLAAFLSYQVGVVVRREQMERAVNFVAEFVQLRARQHVYSLDDFSLADSEKTDRIFGKLFEEVKTSEVIRIKVWDKNGTVIFSDDKSIVGENFADNENFRKSINGLPEVEIKEPLDDENVAERGYEQLMEVYIPVFLPDESSPSGVVEVYYKLDLLNQNIRQAQFELMLTITATLLVLLVILWFLFSFVIIKPIKKLGKGISELKEKA